MNDSTRTWGLEILRRRQWLDEAKATLESALEKARLRSPDLPSWTGPVDVARQGVVIHERGLSEAEAVYRMAGGTDEYLQQLAAEAPDGD
jgi:hypothetical protein